ncbi:MAG: endonuclease VIII, partial [Bacteroidales bacterium]|nr:endonuclease VIII [Bacteroidales bacterium]
MLEIPESKTISIQSDSMLKGKIVTSVFSPKSPHKFAFFNGDPAGYAGTLEGREIISAKGHGMFVDI